MDYFPCILIFNIKKWKNYGWIFHVLWYFLEIMENKIKFRTDSGKKLMDQVRQVLRYHHYSYRTEKTYCDWIVRYIKYFGSKKHPCDMGKIEIWVGASSEHSADLLLASYRSLKGWFRPQNGGSKPQIRIYLERFPSHLRYLAWSDRRKTLQKFLSKNRQKILI